MTVILAQRTAKTDDFTAANQSGLSRAGFAWAQPNASIPRILSNAAANNVTGGYFPAVLTDTPTMTDTHFASCFNVSTLTTVPFGLIVGCDAAFDNYVAVLISNTNVTLGYGTGPTAAETFSWVAKGSSPTATGAGTAWRLEKHVSDTGGLYRVWCNSTLQVEYLDTANTVPSGENNRLGGVIVQRSGLTNSTAVDGFSISDL